MSIDNKVDVQIVSRDNLNVRINKPVGLNDKLLPLFYGYVGVTLVLMFIFPDDILKSVPLLAEYTEMFVDFFPQLGNILKYSRYPQQSLLVFCLLITSIPIGSVLVYRLSRIRVDCDVPAVALLILIAVGLLCTLLWADCAYLSFTNIPDNGQLVWNKFGRRLYSSRVWFGGMLGLASFVTAFLWKCIVVFVLSLILKPVRNWSGRVSS